MKRNLALFTVLATLVVPSAFAVEKGTLAILVNSLDNPYYSAEAKGAQSKAESMGYKRWCCRTAKTLNVRAN